MGASLSQHYVFLHLLLRNGKEYSCLEYEKYPQQILTGVFVSAYRYVGTVLFDILISKTSICKCHQAFWVDFSCIAYCIMF